MRIYKKQVICGVPILKIRNFFKHFSLNNKFKKETFCRSLGIDEQKGEKILNEFLERVRAINADDNLAHYINKVYLFGSFLDKERNDYGDIDLGIEIKPKNYKDDDEYEKKCLEIADQSGRHFSSYLDRVFYAENLIFKKVEKPEPIFEFSYFTG